jgi:hypothetical protein
MKKNIFEAGWTAQTAWVYGLVLGDGHVQMNRGTYRIYFVGNEDTVSKFNQLLEIDKMMFKRGVYHSWFDHKPTAQWFADRGIVGKKTGKLPWPDDIPAEYMNDFLRGLADTDGSFSFPTKHPKGNQPFGFGFSSATKSFAENARLAFECESSLKVSYKTINGKKFTQYSFQNRNLEKAVKLLDKIYGDASFELRNEERYQKYLRAKAMLSERAEPCQICGKPSFSKKLCYDHVWSSKYKQYLCEGCGSPVVATRPVFCGPCTHREHRLRNNPNLVTRRRRS